MKTAIRARFDGKVFVPEEPVDLPEGERVWVLTPSGATDTSQRPKEEAIAALERMVSRGVTAINLPDEALRRENLHED
mgnify:CR=1 FL=1